MTSPVSSRKSSGLKHNVECKCHCITSRVDLCYLILEFQLLSMHSPDYRKIKLKGWSSTHILEACRRSDMNFSKSPILGLYAICGESSKSNFESTKSLYKQQYKWLRYCSVTNSNVLSSLEEWYESLYFSYPITEWQPLGQCIDLSKDRRGKATSDLWLFAHCRQKVNLLALIPE